MARSSSHFTPRNAFQLRIALRACAFVSFFRGASWYIRRSTISGPFCSHVNRRPAPRREAPHASYCLLSTSWWDDPTLLRGVNGGQRSTQFEVRQHSPFALAPNLVSSQPVQSPGDSNFGWHLRTNDSIGGGSQQDGRNGNDYVSSANMNFAVFQALGDRVEAEYRRFNYDDKVFPQNRRISTH